MIGRKALVLFRIAYLSIPILILLKRTFDIDIYFINKDHMDRINNLEKKKIKWIMKEYTEFSEYIEELFLASKFSEIIYEKTKISKANILINKLFARNEQQKSRIEVTLKYYFLRAIQSFADQYAASQYLLKTGKCESVTIISFNSFAYFIKENLTDRIKYLIFPGFLLFSNILKKGVKFSSNFILTKIKNISNLFQDYIEPANNIKSIENYVSRKFASETIEIIYFPHKGIYYGDLFKKDHFYSENSDSPFHKSKILHVSLGEKNEPYMRENYQYYVKNGIPFIDINDLKYSKIALIMQLLKFLSKMHVKIFFDVCKYGFWYLFYVLSIYLSLERYQLILKIFSNLKIALVGFDYLFPRNLSMALSILGIKVCACQERLLSAFWPHDYYTFDYYFVAGPFVKEEGLKNSYIEHCIPIGMIREDKIFEYEAQQVYDDKYDEIKNTKKLVLALDYHMPDNDIEDIMRRVAKVHQTRQFYRNLIRIAKEFPSLHIVIKGKIADRYNTHYISDIVEEIKLIENIEIELDLKKYNPYYIGEKADLTIACYTSLADELLAAGRKVIFYEASDLMETLLTYDDPPIIVKDYDGLKHHIKNFLNGVYLNESAIKTLQEKYYVNCFHGKVQKTVREMLEKIIKDGDLGEHDVKVILSSPQIRKAGEA